MPRKANLSAGDVFAVPLDDGRFVVAQVVATYGEDAYYFAVFEPVFARGDQPDLSEVTSTGVAFLALSFDAKIAAGHWPMLGNRGVRRGVPLPAFKEMVGGPGRIDVVDFSGTRRRSASPEESRRLPNRSFVSPALLEGAVRASHGLEAWHDEYDRLRPSPDTSAKLFD
jgi:hypothetical protein